jgi:O-antigen/teichoic acid export membrane protein
MYRYFNSLTKRHIFELLWIFGGQGLSMIGSLLLLKVLSKNISPDEFGNLALIISYSLIVTQVLSGPLSNGARRFFIIAGSEDDLYNYYLATQNLIKKYIFFVVLFFSFLVMTLIGFHQTNWILPVTLSFFIATISGASAILGSILSAARLRHLVAIFSLGNSLGKVVLVYAYIHFFNEIESIAILSIYSIVALIVLFLQILVIRTRIKIKKTSNYKVNYWMDKIKDYSYPFLFWGAITWIQQGSDKWALGYNASSEIVGVYSVLFQISFLPLTVLTNLLMDFLEPIFFQFAGNARNTKNNEIIKTVAFSLVIATLILTVLLAILTFFIHETLVLILSSDIYTKYSYLFPMLILAGGFFSAGQLVTVKILSELKSRALIPGKILPSLLGVILNIYLSKLYGIDGIAISLLIFSFTYFVWMFYLAFLKKEAR